MTQKKKFPSQVKYIVGNEAAERFSFYGMRSILVVYMIEYLAMATHEAKSIYHLFMTVSYFTPLFGAWLADRYLGKYKTIIYLSFFYCLGHATIAIFEGSQTGLFVGLGLIALGAGGIKPCVSAYVGDQFDKSSATLMDKVYEIFYWSINFGAFFSMLFIPKILPAYGPSVAFGIPGGLMLLATIIFWMGRKEYNNIPPTGAEKGPQFMGVVSQGIKNIFKKKSSSEHWLDVAKAKYGQERVEGAKAVLAISSVFLSVTVFWALFDQQGSSWIIQGRAMEPMFMGIKLEPSQLQALNPILVLLLIPIFSKFIYPGIERLGIKVTPLRKMSVGMLVTGLSFVSIGLLQNLLDAGSSVNLAWQFVPYLLSTVGEIMVSITGLEFAYTQAPPWMKSTVMSLWLLTTALGNFLAAFVAGLNKFQGAMEFHFYAILMIAVSLLFIVQAVKYKARTFASLTPAHA